MTDPTEDVPAPNEPDTGETDENIRDSAPEDAGDEEYYNSEETADLEDDDDSDVEQPEGLFGTHGYPTTYPILKQIIAYFPDHSHVYVTSTTGGTHATYSYHYRGEAIDVGSKSQTYKDRLGAWLYKYSKYITELIHSKAGNASGWYVKNGVRRSHSYYGSTTTRAHVNHVHFAIKTVAQANAMLAAVKKDAGVKPYTYPTSKPSYPGILRKGSVGNSVRTLQRRLNIRGYAPKLKEDGNFGSGTKRNVIAFQKYAKLTPDGIVGPNTFNKLWDMKIT